MVRAVTALLYLALMVMSLSARAMADTCCRNCRPDGLNTLAWLDEEWVLAFRLTAGVKQSAYDTFMDDQRDDDRPLARAFLPPGCLTVSGACDRHYRSGLLNDWPSAHIDDVRVALYKGGEEVAFIVFNGKDSTKDSWFSKDRVLASSWTDLKTESQNYFSILGHFIGGTAAHRHSRRFYIFHSYHGCPQDYGWLSVQDQDYDVCDWGKLTASNPYPAILYSEKNSYDHFTPANLGRADVMTISVRFLKKRPTHSSNLPATACQSCDWSCRNEFSPRC